MCTVALTWAAPQQAKTIQTTQAALDDDQSSTLPPLMNPAILEASDDLTNLSHLNEPAGTYLPSLTRGLGLQLLTACYSAAGD
jgi:myosin heavy subunit